MIGSSDGPPERISRRSLLAAGAAGLTATTAGCMNRVQSLVNSTTNINADESALQITTVPSDDDRQAIQIVRELEANLETLGFDVSLDMRSTTEFQETVFLDQDFDMYVGTYPIGPDPDFLYELLHSSFATEEGWQNPFGFIDFDIDSLLTGQRQESGTERQTQIKRLLFEVAKKKPFIPICLPSGDRAVGDAMASPWERYHPHSRLAYFGDDQTPETLTSIIMSSQPTQNLNPFATAYRSHGTYIDLIYDSLAVDGALIADGEGLAEFDSDLETAIRPWLAESIDVGDSELTLSLREDVQFHDGEELTAADVEFTYEFIADTSMGTAVSGGEPIDLPATNYRRHAATVEEVSTTGDYEVTIAFETNQTVAERALLVPILPKHVWGLGDGSETDQPGALGEFEQNQIPSRQRRWSLLGSDETDLIVGSGPYEFANRVQRDQFSLERFENHFTSNNDGIDYPQVAPETLEFLNDTSSASAVQQVEGGVVDVTTSRIEPHVIEDITAGGDDDVLSDHRSWSFYHIGFNDNVLPCSDQEFRHAVARIVDREWIVDSIFSGHAEPIWTPVRDHPVSDDELEREATEWMDQRGIERDGRIDESQPFAPFCGNESMQEGRVDFDQARRVFESAGFQFDEDGMIVDN
ncbi:hypothetical protein EL22_08050 [Halostagnicola sp. A56]|uniref:ABC transporter substrate-binding protein n=1 Tax=Halostagnicola sp. A56 TaxID=1495067 RepID=UPI00049FA6BC|nr:ABC transporter substrate-binding protein [Halostagnicola sp. A56]KDE60603.1 hypothetical protein EL22_08050 [Halostagnicola sp. A56]